MKIFKSKYNWSVSAHGKSLDGQEQKAYVDVQFPKGNEPEGDYLEGDLYFRDVFGRENKCFLSSYKKKDGTTQIKLVFLKKTVLEQTTLSGDGRDATGHVAQDTKVVIESEELPFY